MDFTRRVSAKDGGLMEHPDFLVLNSRALAHQGRVRQHQKRNSIQSWLVQK